MSSSEALVLRAKTAKTIHPIRESVERLSKIWSQNYIGIREGEILLADNSDIAGLSQNGKVKLLNSTEVGRTDKSNNFGEIQSPIIQDLFPGVLLFEQTGFNGKKFYSEIGRFVEIEDYIGALEITGFPSLPSLESRRARDLSGRMLTCLTHEFILQGPFGTIHPESYYFRGHLTDSVASALLGESKMLLLDQDVEASVEVI